MAVHVLFGPRDVDTASGASAETGADFGVLIQEMVPPYFSLGPSARRVRPNGLAFDLDWISAGTGKNYRTHREGLA
jgi:hypothetical protein